MSLSALSLLDLEKKPFSSNGTYFYFRNDDPLDLEKAAQIAQVKGWICIAGGIIIIVAAIFGSLICLGVPSSIDIITTFMYQAQPLVHAAIGAGAILISSVGIGLIYKGTQYFKTKNITHATLLNKNTLNNAVPLVTTTLTDAGRLAIEQSTTLSNAQKQYIQNTVTVESTNYNEHMRNLLAALLVEHNKDIPPKPVNSAADEIS